MNRQKQKEFSLIFDTYYLKLFRFSLKFLRDEHDAKCAVQESLIKFWENYDEVGKNKSVVEAYLFRVLKNKLIDHYRKSQTKKKHLNLYIMNSELVSEIENSWELQRVIDTIFERLPEKSSELFKLSREEGLSYKEIAEFKNISIKTVEAHISKVLQAFRKGLKEFL